MYRLKKGNQLDVVHNHISSSYTDRGFQNLSQLSTGEYAYDANGNMTQDLNKNIAQISYNLLNLPSTIELTQNRSIRYTYDASGGKLRKTAIGGAIPTTDYVGNHIYKDDKLDYIITDNGRLVANYDSPSVAEGHNLKGFTQEYNVTDHLGNVRLVLNDKKEVVQENSYYPFGMQINSLSYNSKSEAGQNKYLYNGKEKQSEFGLDWLDYGARMYDSQVARFHTVDPLSDDPLNISFTPYHYVVNNPLKYIDPTGMIWTDHEGNTLNDEQLEKVQVYIFYDPSSDGFSEQAMEQYEEAVEKYGEGAVAMSSANTEKEFSKDWGSMAGDISKVNVNFHGSNQAVHLDSKNGEYIVSTGTGKTNVSGTKGINVSDLPTPKGDISMATLNLNTCKSLSLTQHPLKGSKQTIGTSFSKNTNFNTVRGTEGSVSFYNWFHIGKKYLQAYPNNGKWIYLGPNLDGRTGAAVKK